jgi:Zn-finger nucleic acid-binding protein
VHRFTVEEPDSQRICPRCTIPLTTIDLNINGRFLIERCDSCFGLFFDPNELEALLEATVNNVYTIDKQRLDAIKGSSGNGEQGAFYVKCPVCSSIMNRVNFGATSGVIVDRCKEHGIWLDGGELRHLFEWMKAGGKLLQQEREERQRTEATRELEREQRRLQSQQASGGGAYQGDSEYSLFGDVLRSSDPDLFSIVTKAIGYLLR